MFDSLYVLSKGGYCVYNGQPENLREYLLNAKITVTKTQVPIEILLKVASKTKYNSRLIDKFDVDEDIKKLSNLTSLGHKYTRRQCETYGKLAHINHINVGSVAFNFLDFWYLFLRTTKCTLIRGWKSVLFITLFELLSGNYTSVYFFTSIGY